jgi:hypothetical protein
MDPNILQSKTHHVLGAQEALGIDIPPLRSSDTVNALPPLSSALEPDWSYLSAARVLLEANMREAVTRMRWADGVGYDGSEDSAGAARRAALQAGIDRLCALDSLRAYSAPRTERPPDLGHTVEVPQRVHIDDWAGVNGIWRYECGLSAPSISAHSQHADAA